MPWNVGKQLLMCAMWHPRTARPLCFSSERKICVVLRFQHEINAYNFGNNSFFLKSGQINIMKQCFTFGPIFYIFKLILYFIKNGASTRHKYSKKIWNLLYVIIPSCYHNKIYWDMCTNTSNYMCSICTLQLTWQISRQHLTSRTSISEEFALLTCVEISAIGLGISLSLDTIWMISLNTAKAGSIWVSNRSTGKQDSFLGSFQ